MKDRNPCGDACGGGVVTCSETARVVCPARDSKPSLVFVPRERAGNIDRAIRSSINIRAAVESRRCDRGEQRCLACFQHLPLGGSRLHRTTPQSTATAPISNQRSQPNISAPPTTPQRQRHASTSQQCLISASSHNPRRDSTTEPSPGPCAC